MTIRFAHIHHAHSPDEKASDQLVNASRESVVSGKEVFRAMRHEVDRDTGLHRGEGCTADRAVAAKDHQQIHSPEGRLERLASRFPRLAVAL